MSTPHPLAVLAQRRQRPEDESLALTTQVLAVEEQVTAALLVADPVAA